MKFIIYDQIYEKFVLVGCFKSKEKKLTVNKNEGVMLKHILKYFYGFNFNLEKLLFFHLLKYFNYKNKMLYVVKFYIYFIRKNTVDNK